MLTSVGRRVVQAVDLPTLAVIATGDELVPSSVRRPKEHQLRNSNGPMLAAQARLAGVAEVLELHAVDTLDSLAEALTRAEVCDIVVLSGGVSRGRYDLVSRSLAEAGVRLVFHGVRQRPGKPLLFGVKDDRVFFGLPGNPPASHFCFHRYVAPVVRAMAGRAEQLPWVELPLASPLASDDADYHRFVAAVADDDGVRPLLGSGPADLRSVATANAIIHLEPGAHRLAVGHPVSVQRLEEPR